MIRSAHLIRLASNTCTNIRQYGSRLTQFLLVSMLVLMPTNSPVRQMDAQSTFQKGMTYTTWPAGKFGTPDADLALTKITGMGVNWIALIVTQYQDDLNTTSIYPLPQITETDEELIHAIQKVHALGLKVMFKPQLDPLTTTIYHWRGMIGRGFTEGQWKEWFNNYRSFITHYAAMAETYGVEQFCVGVELSESTKRGNDWRDTIKAVRAIYHGPITYAGIGESLNKLTWWDAVDYIGVDPYYNFAVGIDQPTVADIKAAWAPIVTSIAKLAKKWNKPVLITEMGFMSQDGNVQHPWNWPLTDGVIDMEEQAFAYEAAFESLYNQPWLKGIYWWDIGTDPFEGGPCDQHYTPNDKPAEGVVRAWYTGRPGSALLEIRPRNANSLNMLPAGNQILIVYRDGLESGWNDQSQNSQVNLLSTNPVSSGTHAISVTAPPQGTFSIQHAAFDASPYTWLEFYIRRPWVGEQIRVYVNDGNDTELRYLPLCRYMTGPLDRQTWNRVRIPLRDLNAAGQTLTRISFKNVTDQIQIFWIDQIRLVSAGWHTRLPY